MGEKQQSAQPSPLVNDDSSSKEQNQQQQTPDQITPQLSAPSSSEVSLKPTSFVIKDLTQRPNDQYSTLIAQQARDTADNADKTPGYVQPILEIPLMPIEGSEKAFSPIPTDSRISFHAPADSLSESMPSNAEVSGQKKSDRSPILSPSAAVAAPAQAVPSQLPTQLSSAGHSSRREPPPSTMLNARSPVSSNSSGRYDYCSYSVVIRTSAQPKAGTYANVFIQLTDTEGNQTDKCRLKCSITHRKKFCRGHADLFLLVDQHVLGDIQFVDVWHEKKIAGTKWLLHSVNVIEHVNHQLYQFPCGKWVGTNEETLNHIRMEAVGKPIKCLRDEDFQVYS